MSSVINPPTGPKKPVRILQMCAVDFTARQFLLPLTAALECEGYPVAIACARGPWYEEMEDRGFRLIENPVSRNANILHHIQSIRRTVKLLKREKISVLHVHTPVAAIVGRIAARLAGTPLVLYTAHGFYFHENSKPLTRRALVLLEKLGALCGDYIMTVSAEDRQSGINQGIAKPEKIETIYNGVDTIHYDPERFNDESRAGIRQQLKIPEQAVVIGIMGRLVREKGLFEFFEAARKVVQSFPNAWFLVVGDLLPSDYDGKRDELKQHIETMGMSGRTAFAGMVSDPAPYLAAMDIFCLPSYREGMPISLLEAMAMALPCVATDVRGCREEVVDGETGFLIPPRQWAPLADRIETLLADPENARRMGQMGRQRVQRHFDIRKVIDHQLRIYSRLMDQKGLR